MTVSEDDDVRTYLSLSLSTLLYACLRVNNIIFNRFSYTHKLKMFFKKSIHLIVCVANSQLHCITKLTK